jgi:hypothetical protein
MSLWCIQSGRHRLRRLAGAALCVALALAIFGCGRTPPEGFWEPTQDDSAGIMAAVEANKGYFQTGLAELAMTPCDSTPFAGSTRVVFTNELLNNRFKGRFQYKAMEHVFDSVDLKYTYIAGLDTLSQETTCTVTLAETIFGTLRMHAWAKSDSLGETLFFPSPGETLRLPFYADSMTPCDDTIEKPIAGASIEGCVLKKMDGTWQLWKMAGGGRFYAPGPDDAPYILQFYLNGPDDRVDTVVLRPDTLQHGIQRFYSVDPADEQLLTYAVGDWVRVSNLTTNQLVALDYLYFNGQRYEFSETVKFDSSVVTPGIYRLSLEHVPGAVLWETDGEYNATTWGIPIRIQ